MKSTPNIILCTCDELRAFEVGCYGNPVIRTPNIDQFASESVRFEVAVTSFPICMAARSGILSGQYARRSSAGWDNFAYKLESGEYMSPEYPQDGRPHLKDKTLPEYLHDLGYYNSLIGKWHINSWPHDVGFDEYLFPHIHHSHSAQIYTRNGGPEFCPPGYSVDFEADEVADFLKKRQSEDSPFFLFYNISPPHSPLADAPDHYLKMYDPAEIPLRPNVNPEAPFDNVPRTLKVYRYDYMHYQQHLEYADKLPEGYGFRSMLAEYYGLTTWVDDVFGRMVASVEENGFADNTIVVFLSDHGDMLGSNGKAFKGFLNEESIRVPYMIRLPGGNPSRVITGQVANLVDLMPTLMSLLGMEVPEHVHGRDLSPIVRGEVDQLAENYSFTETGRDGIGVRTPTHSYGIRWINYLNTLEPNPHRFYDFRSDPYEQRNLAGTGEQAELAAELDAILRAWHARTPKLERV